MRSAGIKVNFSRAGDINATAAKQAAAALRELCKSSNKAAKGVSVDEGQTYKRITQTGKGGLGNTLFQSRPKDITETGRLTAVLSEGTITDAKCYLLEAASRKLPREKVVELFEKLRKHGAEIMSHPNFRKLLDRDGNLFVNQVINEANGNIAYSSVDFDLDGVSDEEFWRRIDNSPYRDHINRNAEVALFKNAEKLNIIE